jgi:hypothetical protein
MRTRAVEDHLLDEGLTNRDLLEMFNRTLRERRH